MKPIKLLNRQSPMLLAPTEEQLINHITDQIQKQVHPELYKVTWQELKDLRDNNQLISGCNYRITDYDFASSDANITSAHHQFDIVVTALSNNTLSEIASAMMHEDIYDTTSGDNDNYFQNSNLNAWKLWYCLDNDTSRFSWADNSIDYGDIATIITNGGSNICRRKPSEDIAEIYAWEIEGSNTCRYTASETPNVGDDILGEDGNPYKGLIVEQYIPGREGPSRLATIECVIDEVSIVATRYEEGDAQNKKAWIYNEDGTDYLIFTILETPNIGDTIYEVRIEPHGGVMGPTMVAMDYVVDNFTPPIVVYKGKGVIYRMIDERMNDVPWDFKNALFDIFKYTFTAIESEVIYDLSMYDECNQNIVKVNYPIQLYEDYLHDDREYIIYGLLTDTKYFRSSGLDYTSGRYLYYAWASNSNTVTVYTRGTPSIGSTVYDSSANSTGFTVTEIGQGGDDVKPFNSNIMLYRLSLATSKSNYVYSSR